MTEEQVKEIREALEAATPGPWQYEESDDGHEIRMQTAIETPGNCNSHHIIEYNHFCFVEDEEEGTPAYKQAQEAEANARLIANASEWLRQLLAEREALITELNRESELRRQLEADNYHAEANLSHISGLLEESNSENERMRDVLNQIKYMPSTPPIIRKLADRSLSPQEGER